MFGYSIIDGTFAPSIPQPPSITFIIIFTLFNIVGPVFTVGIPLLFFLRFGLISPLITFCLIILLWLSLAVSTTYADTPAYYFVLTFSFIYVPLYILFGGLEWYLRTRGFLPPLPAT